MQLCTFKHEVLVLPTSHRHRSINLTNPLTKDTLRPIRLVSHLVLKVGNAVK